MTSFMLICGALLLAPVLLARLFILARGPAGWSMYLANVFWEALSKRLQVSRFVFEATTAVLGLALLGVGQNPLPRVVSVTTLLLALELAARIWERRLLTENHALPDTIGIRASHGSGAIEAYPSPSTHPDLTLNLEGPFVCRHPCYSLGVARIGIPFRLTALLGNHTPVPTQKTVEINLVVPPGWSCSESREQCVGPLRSGSAPRVHWMLYPTQAAGAGTLDIRVRWGNQQRHISVRYDACVRPDEVQPKLAEIRRYPGGRRSAFAWRGDMDLYDTSTLQSVEGLRVAFDLAAQYCFPQSMYLSTRLALDQQAALEWSAHYGIDRGAGEIPRFCDWMREHVELRYSSPYPATSGKRYVIELGNHGHLHYGTDMSAAPGNHWRPKTRMGEGRYPWVKPDATSSSEQRDNAVEAGRWCERTWGFLPRSWAKPGRCNDMYTAAAVSAAGCEVVSGSDIRARDNVLYQPPPHHPAGTTAVELTTRYPCDPQHVYHVAMLLFWLYRSHRLALPMIYMCHQHLRLFAGHACTRFTEFVLRTVLSRFGGDFYVDTVYGIGKYWREVLSPVTRRVTLSLKGATLTVHNGADTDFVDVPIDVNGADGRVFSVLISLQAGATRTIDLLDVDACAVTAAKGDACRSS